MPNFDPAQVLPEEQTEAITSPVSLPNQFGGVVVGAPVDPVAEQAAADAAAARKADQIAAQSAFQAGAARAPVAANAPPEVVPAPAAAAPAPVEAPPPVAAPQVAPGAPAPPTPAAPATPVKAGGGGGGGAARARAPEGPAIGATPENIERAALNEEAQGNVEAQTGLKKEQAGQSAADLAAVAQQRVKDEQAIAEAQKKGNEYVQQAKAHFDERDRAYQDALEENKTHTVFAGKSTWNMASTYLGMALGAIGAGFSAAGGHPTGNMAVQQLNTEIERDMQKQRTNIEGLKDSTAMALTGLKNATDAKQSLLNDLLAKQNAAYASLEAQARSNAAAFGVKAADLEGSELMTTLKRGQLDAQAAHERQVQQDYLTRLKTHAEIGELGARAEEARAGAALKRAQASGEVGPGGVNINLKLNSAVEQAIDKDAPAKATMKKQAELSGARAAIDSGNPVAIGGALDGLVKSYTGLGARKQMIEIFQRRLGGSVDQVLGQIQGWQNGNSMTPDMVKRLRGAVVDAENALSAEEYGHRQRIGAGLKKNPAFRGHEDVVDAVLDQKFGEGAPGTTAAPADPIREQAQRALNDPNAPPAVKAKAKAYLGL